MESSGQPAKPVWMPNEATMEALRQRLEGLKGITLAGPPAETAASIRETLRGMKDDLRAGASANSGSASPGTAGSTRPGTAAGATVPAPPFDERPELYVGAAFAGGLALAGVMRLLGR